MPEYLSPLEILQDLAKNNVPDLNHCPSGFGTKTTSDIFDDALKFYAYVRMARATLEEIGNA